MNECVHTITTSLHKTGIFWPGGVQSGLGYFNTPGTVWPRLWPGPNYTRVNLGKG